MHTHDFGLPVRKLERGRAIGVGSRRAHSIRTSPSLSERNVSTYYGLLPGHTPAASFPERATTASRCTNIARKTVGVDGLYPINRRCAYGLLTQVSFGNEVLRKAPDATSQIAFTAAGRHGKIATAGSR